MTEIICGNGIDPASCFLSLTTEGRFGFLLEDEEMREFFSELRTKMAKKIRNSNNDMVADFGGIKWFIGFRKDHLTVLGIRISHFNLKSDWESKPFECENIPISKVPKNLLEKMRKI